MSIRKLLVMAITLAFFGVGSAAADKLRVGVEGAYPPFFVERARWNTEGF